MTQRIIKFEVGDSVRFAGYSVSCEAERKRYEQGLCPAQNDERHLKVGGIYSVVAAEDTEYGFYIDIQGPGVLGDEICVHGCSSSSFIKVSNTKTMKITNLVKKILDKDTRTLVTAGFINGDLALTDEGVSELLGILFLEKKEELVKIAQEKLNENTK